MFIEQMIEYCTRVMERHDRKKQAVDGEPSQRDWNLIEEAVEEPVGSLD